MVIELLHLKSLKKIFRNGSIFETFVDQQINADGILESMFGHIQNENSDKDESFKLDSFKSKIDEQHKRYPKQLNFNSPSVIVFDFIGLNCCDTIFK